MRGWETFKETPQQNSLRGLSLSENQKTELKTDNYSKKTVTPISAYFWRVLGFPFLKQTAVVVLSKAFATYSTQASTV